MRDDYDHPSDWEPVKIKEKKMTHVIDHTRRREWPESPEAMHRLIDSAPELLEALKELDDVVNEPNGHEGGWNAALIRASDKARAAIAKAEGEEK